MNQRLDFLSVLNVQVYLENTKFYILVLELNLYGSRTRGGSWSNNII